MHFTSYKNWMLHSTKNLLNESRFNKFYHGSTDKTLSGKNGIHVGTYRAAKEALEARIGVPAEGEWDGTREYGKTLLAGQDLLTKKQEAGIWCNTGFNCRSGIKQNYYPTERKDRAKYSDGTPIPFDCKPIIFEVEIIGPMSNSIYSPHTDIKANSMMIRNLKLGNAKRGYYYENIGEDVGSISAVVPNKSFLKILE